MLIRYDGEKETIVPEPEPDTDVMLFSYLPGLSRVSSRFIAEKFMVDFDSRNGNARHPASPPART